MDLFIFISTLINLILVIEIVIASKKYRKNLREYQRVIGAISRSHEESINALEKSIKEIKNNAPGGSND